MFLSIINLLFTIYTIMLMARIVGSWFPSFARSQFMRFIGYYTDPYLNIFRKVVPPIGGMLDISPMFAFVALQFMQFFLTYLFK